MSMKLDPALTIIVHCRSRGYVEPVREHQFAAPVRKWAFDLAWPALKIAVEIDGGAFHGSPCPLCKQRPGGRHNRGKGYRDDLVKFAEAACRGWRVVRVMPEQIVKGKALGWLDRLLARSGRS